VLGSVLEHVVELEVSPLSRFGQQHLDQVVNWHSREKKAKRCVDACERVNGIEKCEYKGVSTVRLKLGTVHTI
jgi:hypothetical protein